MARYTKCDADGRYYIESANGKLESNIKGHTYGEAIDRFAELENADVVEIVRCKDCIHGSENADGSISCNCFMADSMPPTGFCSFGEC